MSNNACQIIQKALINNHNLIGLHINHRNYTFDANGFIKCKSTQENPELYQAHIQKIYNNQSKYPNNKVNWKSYDNCWICEKWINNLYKFN